MLYIKVLGPGCLNCYLMRQVTVDALEMLDVEATMEHITDYLEMRKYPIMYTPGLVINEELVCAGRIPSIKEVISWVKEALEKEDKAREYEVEPDLSRGDEKSGGLGQASQQGGHSK
ncbi:MAG TPA: hypothetical protein DCP08_05305 [Chloroflexi bacterium]|nr:hypothetical protein [Chloroflexota bacterium]